jgi:5-methylcytosine-specific restriction endonuclease McrA
MQLRTLVLTPWMSPHRIATWQDGVVLAVTGKCDVLEEYDVECASPSVCIQVPAVARLRKEIHANKRGVKFSRTNVYQRDGHRCCYCAPSVGRHPAKDLTYDHVLPRSRGGQTTWENIVTACRRHNTLKDDRTPAEAGLHMHFQPHKPRVLPMTAPFLVDLASMPEQWEPYVRAMVRQQAG